MISNPDDLPQDILAAALYFAAHGLPVFPCLANMTCPLLSGPVSILELAIKEDLNGKETQARGHHRQAA